MKRTNGFATTVATIAKMTAATVALTGCFGGAQTVKPTLVDATSTGPFVEGYLEFAGPADKWVGPRTLLVHVVSEPVSGAEIALNPRLLVPGAEAQPGERGELRLTGELARDQLRVIGEAIALETLPELPGCMYPVRARLIRADGSFVERQGCRSLHGWTNVMSQGTHKLMVAAYRPSLAPQGPTDEANRMTASSK